MEVMRPMEIYMGSGAEQELPRHRDAQMGGITYKNDLDD